MGKTTNAKLSCGYGSRIGTIVDIYEPDVFEVEFCDLKGKTYALQTLTANELLLLHYNPFIEKEAA